MQSTEPNPYAPPRFPHESGNAILRRQHDVQMPLRLVVLLVLQLVVIAAAMLAEAHSHRTIIYSGPIFVLVGLLIAVVGYRAGDRISAAYGGSAFAFACLVEFLIKFNHWHASQADEPITRLAIVYTICAYAITFWPLVWRPHRVK